MPNLKQARKGRSDKLIKEHEADLDGDLDKLEDLIKRPIQETGKSSSESIVSGRN